MNNDGNETFMQVAQDYISGVMRKQLGATAFPVRTAPYLPRLAPQMHSWSGRRILGASQLPG